MLKLPLLAAVAAVILLVADCRSTFEGANAIAHISKSDEFEFCF